MTDNVPQYKSDGLEIYEWPQPVCEIVDRESRDLVSIRTPEDAKALRASLAKFIQITDRCDLGPMTKRCLTESTATEKLFVELKELRNDYMQIPDKDTADVTEMIEKVLQGVEQFYYLVPRYDHPGDANLLRVAPVDTIALPIAQLWADVNS